VRFEEFEERARQEWDRIPEEYRAGVDGLVVERSASPHPSLPDVYTMGECRTETYPSDFGGPDTIRSLVVLFYGSFFRLSRVDPSFDWEGELWETLTHELQHHLESLASDDSLVDMDYAADENYKRYEGESFDPFFYRHGIPEQGWLRVDDEFFRELVGEPGDDVTFDWNDRSYAVTMPADSFDIAYVAVTSGVTDTTGALNLVVLRPTRGWKERLAAMFRGAPPRIVEHELPARAAVGPKRGGE
jgi:hypothetical protein